MIGRELNAKDAAFIYINYELNPDDFRLLRRTSDNLVLWCISRNREVVLRR